MDKNTKNTKAVGNYKRAKVNTKNKNNPTSLCTIYLNSIKTYRYIVPEGACPLDIMATMGNELEDAWVYISTEVLNELQKTSECSFVDGSFSMEWPATPKYPEAQLVVKYDSSCWWSVVSVRASDIPYADRVPDPGTIIFITVE